MIYSLIITLNSLSHRTCTAIIMFLKISFNVLNNFIERKNKFDNSLFLSRKINSKVLSANLLSLFLKKTCYHSSLITGDSTDDNHVDQLKCYEYMKKKVDNFEWSILDYFINSLFF